MTAEEKANFWECIKQTNAKYLVWSAAKERTREQLEEGAKMANDHMARTEAVAAAMEAEIAAANPSRDDIDEDKEMKKKVAMYDILDDDALELINADRETLGHRVVTDADQLNKLKLKSNREHILMPGFEEAFKGIGGQLNMPDGFIDQEEPKFWPTVTFGDVKLKVHQVVGVYAMKKLLGCRFKSAILSDDVGTGKTISTLALLCSTVESIGKKLVEEGYSKPIPHQHLDSCRNHRFSPTVQIPQKIPFFFDQKLTFQQHSPAPLSTHQKHMPNARGNGTKGSNARHQTPRRDPLPLQ